jgi:hypothetical protein
MGSFTELVKQGLRAWFFVVLEVLGPASGCLGELRCELGDLESSCF